ncbi:MAG TPA: pantothenate kinase [Clostridia bacterium]|nr:pantothenate kinase [Clostridiales bacterium]HZK45682.1 pantothenate kinase [Clostridia bacterium]
MGIVLGIDIGGSTTKIAGYLESGQRIGTLRVEASDRLTSLYGAIGNFLSTRSIALNDVACFVITGVGAALVEGDIYGIRTERIDEFVAIGNGGLALSGKEEALVVSLGTGTAFVRAGRLGCVHIGGSGVGGGTLAGLSWHIFHENDHGAMARLAEQGDLSKVDLMISDICTNEVGTLPSHITASNFGKITSAASKEDIAMGLVNMVFQTVGMLSVFALKNDKVKDVVLTGSLANMSLAPKIMSVVEEISDVKFFIPENATFATAIGAALPFVAGAKL